MLGVSGMIGTASGDGAAGVAAAAEAQESGGTSGGSGGTAGTIPGGGFSEEDKARMEEEGERAGGGGGGGNRWPRQETMALLKIRSDMDVVFRDSSLKGPLWEQVSRKMAELGYHRTAKKCKEKFENVYKYHKRTKEGRSTKPDGKSYRFFDALEALENTSSSLQFPTPPPRPQAPMPATMAVPMQAINANPNPNPPIAAQITVSSTPIPVSVAPNVTTPQSFNSFINSSFPPSQGLLSPVQPRTENVTNPPQSGIVPPSHQTISTSFLSNSTSSSSTSSDEDIERRHKRKRKWKDFFEKVMKDVIVKQEELQKRFLETLEKRERDRMIREEAWRVQEMARINREHDLLVQERSITAARESALISFLQKMTEQQNPQNPNSTNPPQLQISLQLPENPLPQPSAPARPPAPAPAPLAPVTIPVVTPPSVPAPVPTPIRTVDNTPKSDNGGENFTGATSSRWPKTEVEALIKLRTSLDNKYQENGPKGPLWEDISAGMRRIGYNRSAKRCKEKWENINKYFKKVKESNKRRPEDSKTCPYFHQLEALYKEKAKGDTSSYNTGYAKPENPMVPIMARPEQQWPIPQDPQQQLQQQQQESAMHEQDDDNIDQNDHDDDDDDDDGDDDEEDEGSGYEIVSNKPSSVATTVG